MKGFLIFLCLLVGALIVLAVPPMAAPHAADYGLIINAFYTGKATLLCTVFAVLAGWYAYRQEQHGAFLLQIFIAALLLRLIVASLIFANYGQEFFGGDAFTYDFLGQTQLRAWAGDSYAQVLLRNRMSGWGMGYFVGSVYGDVWPTQDDAFPPGFRELHNFSQRFLLHQHRSGENHISPFEVGRFQLLHVEID
jgi:hypothetical protein